MALLRVVAVLCVAWPLLLVASFGVERSTPSDVLLLVPFEPVPTYGTFYTCEPWISYAGTVRRDC